MIGIYWECEDAAEIDGLLDVLDTMRGLDENGNNVDTAQVSGIIHTASLTGAEVAEFNARYPYITIRADHVTSYLRYYNYNTATEEYDTLMDTITCIDGVPERAYGGTAPTRPETPANKFTFNGWSKSQNATTPDSDAESNVVADRNIYAAYIVTGQVYTVRFIVDGSVKQTVNNVPYGGSATYTGAEPTSSNPDYKFNGWLPTGQNITGNTDCIAQWLDMSSVVIKYLKNTLTEIDNDLITALPEGSLARRSALTSVKTMATDVKNNALNASTNVEYIEFKSTSPVTIGPGAFNNLMKLKSVVVRSTTMSTLQHVNAFSGTPIARLDGAIYVPSNLVDTYKADNNWKNFFIASIDDYPLNNYDTITDDLDTIKSYLDAGTISDHYSIKDTKTVNLDENTKVRLQIASLGGDELSSGGNAPVTFVFRDILRNENMNTAPSTDTGWVSMPIYTTIQSEILPKIEALFGSGRVKEVVKTYTDYSTGSKVVKSSNEKLWLLSEHEMYNNIAYENTGVVYNKLFDSNSSRRKYLNGSAENWWLRSASSRSNFRYVNDSGNNSSANAGSSCGLVLGFCLGANE